MRQQRAWCGPGWQGWPAVSARRLSELDKGERRRAWLHTVAVLTVAWVVLVGRVLPGAYWGGAS